MEGCIGADWGWNYWQQGYNATPIPTTSAMVEACVSAYSQTIAMCPGTHWMTNAKGGRDRVATSALSRVLKKPNGYQSISDFMLNAVRSLYLDGNAYALCLRNNRYEIGELHLMNPRHCAAKLAETGEIFYGLGGNEIIAARFIGAQRLTVPARDVLHIRLHTPYSPLVGVSSITAAALDIAASGYMTAQQARYFQNQARPSFVLTTDQVLSREQATMLRESWNAQAQGLSAGGTPILSNGLKAQTLSSSNSEAQLAEVMKMTDQHIALAFRVPLPILGINNQTAGSTEELMRSWHSSGLGFALNHVEEAFGQLFELKGLPEEYLEFDTSALLRSNMKERIEALARGVQGGIYSPNEARLSEGYGRVADGDEPRVQQQVVPLSFGAKLEPPKPPSEKPPPSEAPPPANLNKPAPAAEGDRNERVSRLARALKHAADARG
jgi:HK97 family phage portal protein